MLTIDAPRDRRRQFCDAVNRRNFLKIGSLGLTGLTLPRLLEAEARSGGGSSRKSVILIYLVGGPPHQDMFDLKPEAPREIAGPFRPIATNVPGIEICEHMPRLVADDGQARADPLGRRRPGRSRRHAMLHGPAPQDRRARRRLAAVRLGRFEAARPARARACRRSSACATPPRTRPTTSPGRALLAWPTTAFGRWGRPATTWCLQASRYDQLGDRKALAGEPRSLSPRASDASGKMDGMDAFTEQAMGILTSSRLADALDLSKEDPQVVERYGTGDEKVLIDDNGAPRVPQSFLVARRLVEAGARVVTLNYSKWDWHGHPVRLVLRSLPRRPAGVRPGLFRSGRGPARSRAGQGRDRGRVGRVRPHADDQQERRPRPLAARRVRTLGRRRHAAPVR